MKAIRKDIILEQDIVRVLRMEKDVLQNNTDHPFLVSMDYVFQDEQRIYFVLKYICGGELFSQMKKQRFTEERARFYVIQIALALSHLHSKNILYRDLKPENILLDEDGYIAITDFGLSKIMSNKKAVTHTVAGTPLYLAPEVISGKYSYEADWWSLGVLTYEMVVGDLPFSGSKTAQLFERIKTQ